ncbi:MAG TPA: O-methyltransferase [Candidatus Acidoferrales bacterium]
MAGIFLPAVEKYLSTVIPASDPVLLEMEAYARKHDVPIIGPECGRLLYLLTQISGAKRIFEMGSAIGYSAIWFASAAGPQAEIYYTDGDPKNAAMARENFQKARIEKQVHILTGDAVDLIDSVSGDFDIILIDVFKHQYPAALKKSLPRLKHGGLLIADNVLWSGRVTEAPKDEMTRGILEFTEMIYSSKELFPVIVPLRDGVAVCRKA